MAEEGAAREAAAAAEAAVDSAQAVAGKALDLTADTARDVVNTLLTTVQRITDAVLGPAPRE